MPDRPIDLDAVRRTEAKLDQLLREHPELREANPERQQALDAWINEHLRDTDREATRQQPPAQAGGL